MHLFKIDKEWSAAKNEFPIIFMGDFHGGCPNCDYDLLESAVDEISKEKEAIVFLMGDLAEYITKDDKRFLPSQIDRRFWGKMEYLPMAYLEWLVELLEPIAHFIEVVHDGNHERSIISHMYPGLELCSRLRAKLETKFGPEFAQTKLKYAPGEAYTKITFKTRTDSDYKTIMVNSAHGWQGGRQPGGKHNALFQLFEWVNADIIMRAHAHDLFAEPGPVREEPNPQMTKLVEIPTICGCTGSFLRTRNVEVEQSDRPGYAEYRGYRPSRRGYVRVDLKLSKKEIERKISVK